MIKINTTKDITDKVVPNTTDGASWSDIFGLIAKKREYIVNDPRGEYHPKSPKGYLFRHTWRNMDIVETNDHGVAVFKGQIYDVFPQNSGDSVQIKLSCRDPLAVKMDWPVDLCDRDTFDGWQADAFTAAGETEIVLSAISGSPNDPPVGSVISFNTNYSPSYLVTAFDTGTNTVTLDRALIDDVEADTAAQIAVPILQTPAQALKRAFQSVELDTYLGGSFDQIHAADAAANRYLWLFIQPQNKVRLSDFIQRIMEYGDLYPQVSNLGVIDVRRGLEWDGIINLPDVTPAELINPIDGPYDDTTRLCIAYDLPFISASLSVTTGSTVTPLQGEVKIVSNEVPTQNVIDWVGVERWKPIPYSASDMREYEILYGSEPTAIYFGERRLNYYGVGRTRIKCALKQSESGRPRALYNLTLFKDVLLTIPLNKSQSITEVPATVVEYQYDRTQQRYTSVTFEVINTVTAAEATTSYLLTESNGYLLTEAGEFIAQE